MRNIKLVFKLLFLLLILALGILHFNSLIRKERIYYIPQINTYIKLVEPSSCNYGYVFFSGDDRFVNSTDFFKIWRIGTAGIVKIVFNPEEREVFYILNRYGKHVDINSDKYKMSEIEITDSTFFNEPQHSITTMKKPYESVSIEYSFEGVYLTFYENTSMKKIYPIKEYRKIFFTKLK